MKIDGMVSIELGPWSADEEFEVDGAGIAILSHSAIASNSDLWFASAAVRLFFAMVKSSWQRDNAF